MSEAKTPENKKRKSLSLSKNRNNSTPKAIGSSSQPAASPSILALFKNAPPPKLSCPLCGEMVPRFSLNKHIDEECPKAKAENDDIILVEDGKSVQLSSSTTDSELSQEFETQATKADGKTDQCKKTMANTKQDSPYFKTNPSVADIPKEVKVVKTVPLGSLSSKLSRRYQTRRAESKDTVDCLEDLSHDSPNTHSFPKESPPCKSNGQSNGLHSDEGTHCTDKETLALSLDTLSDDPEVSSDHKLNPVIDDGPKILLCNAEDISCKQDRIREPLKRKLVGHHWNITSDGKKAKFNDPQEATSGPSTLTKNCDDSLDVSSSEDKSRLLPMEDSDVIEFVKPRDTDGQEEAGEGSNKENASDFDRQPYYLRNFSMVLQTVMENEEDMRLFNEEDRKTLTAFNQLPAGGQKLYVRLFQRKLNWIKTNKIEYSEIGSDLTPYIEELNRNGFLQSDCELEDLTEALDLLPAPELKNLAKAFHLKNPNAPKQQIVEEFLKLSKQRSIFSLGKNQSGISAAILKKAKDSAGRAVRVCRAPRAVFSRVLLLFSLTQSMEVEEAASGGQSLLSTVLMVNMGRMTFPNYTVQRSMKIFQDREDLIRYECAMHKLVDIVVTMINGNWKEAHVLYQSANVVWDQLKNEPTLRYHAELPLYLRCFTVGWVYTRILCRGVEILQRLHLYEEAVELLQALLSQNIYCPDSRGRWWDRLVLNLHQHLKHTQKAVTYIMEGLSDPYVRTGHQLSLYQRAVRMRDSPSCKKFHKMFNNLPEIIIEDVPHVTIKGKMYPQAGMGKSVFIMENVAEEVGEDITVSTVMCSVEELALAHYRELGYDQGIHGEGSTFCTLYGLFMWDIIFMEGIPDVFRNTYQAFPLDLHTDSFYENRREAIECRLQLLQESSAETLHSLMADVWNEHLGEAAALVSWERFSSLQQAQSLVSCLGGSLLSGLCKIMSKDIRHCKGGLPDLVVWNVQKKMYKVVEVKGPNDRLSHKQMVWLHELKKMGAEAEVCHVVAIGAKSNRLN
ncbi:PREDICTED: fanconi-associated nuclease 1 [Nanorana parkeri]|uniref:fanconi-associated nuclease 1 n=1 Tax=Nanorana parkeri TaxID=125878 RepID=UPI0008549059|nr:PREDICTED: fanconi-associated nuclease 1 [Nanorana parkeri]